MVACYWEFSASESLPMGHQHSIPLDGCVSLAHIQSNFGGLKVVFIGPRLESLKVPIFPGDLIRGVRFLPGASRAAIGKPGSELFGKFGLLGFEMPDLAKAFTELVGDCQSLEDLASRPFLKPSDAQVEVMQGVSAITASRGAIKAGELPAVVGLSERQFQRVFRNEVGLTPKQYARICRLRSTALDVLNAEQTNWGEIAAERGYADQAHLIHEFQALFGISPREFESRYLVEIEHGEMRKDL